MSSAPAELLGPTLPRSWRWLLPCLFAPPMLIGAASSGQRALLFPESLALAFGGWVLRRPEVTVSRWRIAVLPSACAGLGVSAARLPGPRWLVAIGVLSLTLLLLQLTCCRVAPAVSAGVLPVVFHVTGPAYLISVVTLCTIVAATVPKPVPAVAVRRWGTSRLIVFWLIGVVWLAVVGVSALPPIAVAPPLLVATLEFVLAGPRAGASWLRRSLLLAAAGLVGALCLRWIPVEWVAGTVAVTAVALLALAVALPLAPALAVCLVPFVADAADPLATGCAIALGALVLHLVAWTVLTAHPRLVRARRVRSSRASAARVVPDGFAAELEAG